MANQPPSSEPKKRYPTTATTASRGTRSTCVTSVRSRLASRTASEAAVKDNLDSIERDQRTLVTWHSQAKKWIYPKIS